MTTSDFLDYWADLDWREFRIHAGLYVILALLFVIVGPFETGDQPFLYRLIYWFSALSVFGGLVMPIVARLVRGAGWFKLSPLVPGAMGVISLAAIPMTAIVLGSDPLIMGLLRVAESFSLISLAKWEGEMDSEPYGLAEVLLYYVQVLVIVVISIGLVSAVVMQRKHDPKTEQGLSIRPGVTFFSRLPDHLGTDLLYMQMEDHYLRVVTKAGEALILVRFRDAINELEAISGLQVHRSWWVVSAEIEKLSRVGRKSELLMSDGARVPVSSSFKESVDQLLTSK
ncbi:MAG: LytTR family DNA-binding domain-containing protein [Parasphingorhabdus sp.]